MKGTLAIWYEPVRPAQGAEPSPTAGMKPELELHFNLWRDLPSGISVLDVGMLLEKTQDLGRLHLYIPAEVTKQTIKNLSPVLSMRNTLNAVFNDVVRQEGTLSHGYLIRRSNGDQDAVHSFGPDDIDIAPQDDDIAGAGTIIAFREGFCRRIADAPADRSYVRFRISLPGAASDTFSSELQSRDRAFVSTIGQLELTEFRLNERRSFPKAVAELSERKAVRIKTIHYFLIRDLERQLIMQHAPFEKVRRLETGLWADYLESMGPGRSTRVGTKLQERLVIYHWKAKETLTKTASGEVCAEQTGISDFVAFASFRGSTSHLLYYAIVIVLLGATGSALAAAMADFFGLPPFRMWRTLPTGTVGHASIVHFGVNLLIAAVLFAVILVLAYWRPISIGARFVWRLLFDRRHPGRNPMTIPPA